MTRKIIITLALLLIMLIPANVSAAGNIKLLDSSTSSSFPILLTFNVKASSPVPIERIRLRYQVDKITFAPSFAEAWPDFQPGDTVSANWVWDMRKGSLPPGAQVTYWWIIEDASGNRLVTPKQTISYSDDRYKWQQIVGDGNITLNWYQGSRTFANSLLLAAVDAKKMLEHDTGATLSKPIVLYIYANYANLRGSMVAPEQWTGGVTYAGFNIISIGISTSNLEWGKKAVAHEMGHLVTHQLTTSPYGADLPPWLDEGLAMHAEGPQSDSDKGALTKAIEDGRLATLKSLSSPFSADSEQAFYSYAESQSVVEFMINKYGNDKMNELLVSLNNGYSMDDALTKVYGFNLDGLEEAWVNYMLPQQQPAPKTRELQLLKQFRPGDGLALSRAPAVPQ